MEPNYCVLMGVMLAAAGLAALVLLRPRPEIESEVRMLRYMLFLMPSEQALMAERHPSAVMIVRRIGDNHYEAFLAGLHELRRMQGTGAAVALAMADFQPNPLLWWVTGIEMRASVNGAHMRLWRLRDD